MLEDYSPANVMRETHELVVLHDAYVTAVTQQLIPVIVRYFQKLRDGEGQRSRRQEVWVAPADSSDTTDHRSHRRTVHLDRERWQGDDLLVMKGREDEP
jgi:hypothetical protein